MVKSIKEIVKEYLIEHHFDGLAGDFCGCGLNDLFPCECNSANCMPGYEKICSNCRDHFYTSDKCEIDCPECREVIIV